MSVLIYLPFFIASLFLFFRVSHLRKIQAHVKEVYPNEWDKICVNKMGMNNSTAKSANLEESMKSGFLSQQHDPLIINFHRKDRLLITAMAIFGMLQLVLAFLK